MRAAFSLVELSIVLVILGLLTGGILAGQNLIRAAELRNVVTEYKNYQTAVMTFKDKYFTLPGDLRNATEFWGAAATLTNGVCDNAFAEGTGTQTCNGDGDGLVGGTWTAGIPGTMETVYFWEHLSNAGLIEGKYTGGFASGMNFADYGQLDNPNTSPKSKVGNSRWIMGYHNTADPFGYGTFSQSSGGMLRHSGSYWEQGHGHFLIHVNNSFTTNIGALLPEEAWQIDTKIDDGVPARGKLWVTPNCTTVYVATDAVEEQAEIDAAEYSLTDESSTCGLIFVNLF